MYKALFSILFPTLFIPALAQGRYDYTVVDNRVIVTDFVTFDDLAGEHIFINALLFAIDQGTSELENIEEINFETQRFIVKQQVPSAEYGSAGTSYKFTTQIQVAENMLSFLTTDIQLETKGFLNEYKNIAFERLDPEKKPKHQTYLNEFISAHSGYLNRMFEFIRSNEHHPITHWDELKAGRVVKGMNETECTLVCGKPRHVRETGGKTRWLFSNNFVVFFENGVITSIID